MNCSNMVGPLRNILLTGMFVMAGLAPYVPDQVFSNLQSVEWVATDAGQTALFSQGRSISSENGGLQLPGAEAACSDDEESIQRCHVLEQNILASTLRIEMKTWIIHVEGKGSRTFFGDGHGTVVGGRYLLTHGHFKRQILALFTDEVNGNFATIDLFQADGTPLWRGPLTAATIAYDSGETLLLEFAAQNGRGLFDRLGVPSAELGASNFLDFVPGAVVAQVNWDNNQAAVQWTTIEGVDLKEETAAISLGGCILPGSSGGGVFLNGVHIANNWLRSEGCVDDAEDETLLYSRAALNTEDLLAATEAVPSGE